jgi:hypothetical protein
MAKLGNKLLRSALASFLVFGATTAATLAEDLSKYRDVQLGTDLPTVAKQVDASPTQAKVIHSRPALIQELEWSPRPLGPTARAESVKEVVFSFYNGELFRIAVTYDSYETEGMTVNDFVKGISETYGTAEKPAAADKAAQGGSADPEEVLARWQDPQYRFDLIRASYGPGFRLIGVLRRLETPAQAAITEATRLDEQEAPQRDAARIVSEKEVERARLEKARLMNTPNFRP